jgi:protein-S-isoprenylcysteine O-methyltransferase Ste14
LTVASHFFPKPYADVVAKLRVPFGFVLIALFLWLANPDRFSLLWGLPTALYGLWMRGWAAGHLYKDQNLAVSGPYARVRNPLYVGTLIAGTGLIVAAQSWPLAVVFAVYFGLIFLPVIELEEQHLAKLFPDYRAYQNEVPMLLPLWTRTEAALSRRFSWTQYRRNREYQAGFAMGAAILFLIWKVARPHFLRSLL